MPEYVNYERVLQTYSNCMKNNIHIGHFWFLRKTECYEPKIVAMESSKITFCTTEVRINNFYLLASNFIYYFLLLSSFTFSLNAGHF